ncbi:MAG TPA: mandelate racemase/muconate lactonizing enzyme family protein [Alphaproteobacteria bacterium]|nr:mandelate racemase/muconate lactonizing enzyme family protein [Alphaproteobacteria bacterium]
MKITRARIYLLRIAGRHPVIVELETDEGITGLGDAAVAYGSGATAAAGMIKDLFEDVIRGRDPFRIEALWGEMYDHSFWAKGGGPIVFAGISAIETALWDIKGKVLGLPVYELLGGKQRDEVRLYANGWSFRCVTPEDFARAAVKAVEDGYDALKMYPLARPLESSPHGNIKHIAGRQIDRDFADLAVAKVKAVRKAIGPGIDLMLDMSAELTADAAIALGRRMVEFDILFFEEPVDPFDAEGLRKVADQVGLPIAVGERLYTRYGFRRVLELRAADILQPDIGNTGGIAEAKKIADMAEAYGLRVQPHLCASPVATAAALQLDAAIRNLLIQELYPYRVSEHFDIVDRPPEREVKAGRLPIPDRPGLGVALVPERVRPYLWAECGE